MPSGDGSQSGVSAAPTMADLPPGFEKFLVTPGAGEIIRFRPGVEPEAPELVAAIEANLPG